MKMTTSKARKNNQGLVAGYQWEASQEKLDRQPILPIDTIAPAGAIVSNVDDMSRWLTMLLAAGEFNGKRLLQQSTIEEMWTTQIHIADGVGYGMGWFVRDWDGHRYIEHGGNINGFAAQVGLLPDDGLGFVLLTNLTATPLQGTVGPIVWDELLGEDQPMTDGQVAEAGSADAEDLSLLLGTYAANFGTFNDADFEVTEKEGVLFVNVPGQTNYEIKSPNDDGRRPFAMTDTIAVSFERNATGGVDIMRMHQGGLDFELPRRGYTPPAEIDEAELLPYLGKYKSTTFNSEVSLILRNGRLAIDIPSQMAFELRLPGEDGRRRFRVRDVMSVEFESDEAGAITGMALRRGDELIETIPRTGGPDGEPLPTLDELMALRATDERRAAQKNAGMVYTLSDANFVNAGLGATISEWSEGATFRTDVDLGKFGWSHTLVTPESGLTLSHITPEEEFGGRRLRTVHDASSAMRLLDWRDGFEKVQILKREEIDGTPTIRVMLRNPDSPPITVYCDEKTGDVLRLEASLPIPAANSEIPMVSTLSDYRDVDGLRIPFKMSMHNSQTGITEITIRKVTTRLESCEEMMEIATKQPCAR
jgi:hypothetical protein